jgi:hypothetical protein
VEIKLASRDGRPVAESRKQVAEVVSDQISGLSTLIKRVLVGETKVF